MRPKSVAQAILDGLNADGARVNLYIWGAAGVGKSAVTKQVADAAGVDFLDIRASQLDPTDIRGVIVPDMTNGVATWLAPEWLPKRADWTGIIFLDELNLAPMLVQSAFYELIWDRSIGDYELPKGAMIVAAGNRKEDGAPAHNMPAPLRNRFCHLVFDPNLIDWSDWAMKNRIVPDVIAFNNWKVDSFAPAFNMQKNENAFPSPRTWEFVSRLMSKNDQGMNFYKQDADYIRELITGCVGTGAASEFMSFVRLRDELPDVDEILAGKFPSKIPEKADVCYSLVTTLAVRATEFPDAKRVQVYGTMINYLNKLSAEYQALCLRLVGGKDSDTLRQAPEWKKWIQKNQKIFVR